MVGATAYFKNKDHYEKVKKKINALKILNNGINQFGNFREGKVG